MSLLVIYPSKLLRLLLIFFVVFVHVSLQAAVPSKKNTSIGYQSKNASALSPSFLQDSVARQQDTGTNAFVKPKKKGIGSILGGVALVVLGSILGLTLLIFFLFGLSFTNSFYYEDIYLLAVSMLAGLGILGVGIFLISRGTRRWKAYRRYKKQMKALKKMDA